MRKPTTLLTSGALLAALFLGCGSWFEPESAQPNPPAEPQAEATAALDDALFGATKSAAISALGAPTDTVTTDGPGQLDIGMGQGGPTLSVPYHTILIYGTTRWKRGMPNPPDYRELYFDGDVCVALRWSYTSAHRFSDLPSSLTGSKALHGSHPAGGYRLFWPGDDKVTYASVQPAPTSTDGAGISDWVVAEVVVTTSVALSKGGATNYVLATELGTANPKGSN